VKGKSLRCGTPGRETWRGGEKSVALEWKRTRNKGRERIWGDEKGFEKGGEKGDGDDQEDEEGDGRGVQ